MVTANPFTTANYVEAVDALNKKIKEQDNEIERLRVDVEVLDDRRVKAVVYANNLGQENERLRETLQKIADIEHENIPSPKTPTEGIMWTVLAMAVGLAEDALKEKE